MFWKDEANPLGPPADPNSNTPLDAAALNALEAKGLIHGTGAPTSGDGVSGNFYIDVDAGEIWGPRDDTGWGSAPLSLSAANAPSGPAGGVLGGTFPNPTFSQDMATQPELDKVTLGTDWSTGSDASALVSSPATQTPARRQHIKHGTLAAPITVAGPTMKVSRFTALSRASQDAAEGVNTPGIESQAAILGVGWGVGNGCEAQTNGVTGEARTNSASTTPNAVNDATGVMGYGRVFSPGTGLACGAYFEAIRDAGAADGYTVSTEFRTAQNRASDSYSASGPSKTMGLWINNHTNGQTAANSYVGGCGIQLGGIFGKYDVGVGFNALSVVSSSVRDDSSAARSIDIRGTHATAAIEVATGAGPVVLNNNYIQLTERTAPGAPATNSARLYLETDGAYQRLMLKYDDGTTDIICTNVP